MTTKYFSQVIAQQADIEFRLERMSQQPMEAADTVDDDADMVGNINPDEQTTTPPFVLSTKWKALHSPIVSFSPSVART